MKLPHSILHRIVRSAHCRGTHHLFAIDALSLVRTEPGRRLVSLLMRYHRQYLTGATDPDTRICDFHNQVIHVEDGYWGGAPRVANQWYNRLQGRLRRGDYADAATAAGILSHYFTDPIQPMHTASTDREALVHRPLEWSIYQSYDSILQRWEDSDFQIVFQLSSGPDWLGSAMLHSARYAHQKFALLVNSYRFDRGIEDPLTGLDQESKTALAELFGLAITGWARVIERAAQELETTIGHPLPTFSSAWPTALACVRSPVLIWLRRVQAQLETLAIEDLADEYRRSGCLEEHLPEEIDIKRRVIAVYHSEKRYRLDRERRRAEKQMAQKTNIAITNTTACSRSDSVRPKTPVYTNAVHNDMRLLSPTDSILSAPSMSPTIAERFESIGVRTVGSLLTCNPTKIAARLNVYWIDVTRIETWQKESSLMCFIPGLRATDAQILVGSGFRSAHQLASSDARIVHAEILRFALTDAGRRYLQANEAPSIEMVSSWIELAQKERRSA